MRGRRPSELLATVVVTAALMTFAWLLRDSTPGIAGLVVGAVVGHWLPARSPVTKEPTRGP